MPRNFNASFSAKFSSREEWEDNVHSKLTSGEKDWHDGGEIDAGGDGLGDVEELLRALDDDSATVPVSHSKTLPGNPHIQSRTAKFEAWAKKHEQWLEENKLDFYPKKRAMDRAEYADKQAAKGKTVRSWTDRSEDWLPGESEEERQRRFKRDYERARTGKTNDTVREYKRLESMTSEEKAAYKRAQNAENKRKRRAELKNSNTAAVLNS